MTPTPEIRRAILSALASGPRTVRELCDELRMLDQLFHGRSRAYIAGWIGFVIGQMVEAGELARDGELVTRAATTATPASIPAHVLRQQLAGCEPPDPGMAPDGVMMTSPDDFWALELARFEPPAAPDADGELARLRDRDAMLTAWLEARGLPGDYVLEPGCEVPCLVVRTPRGLL